MLYEGGICCVVHLHAGDRALIIPFASPAAGTLDYMAPEVGAITPEAYLLAMPHLNAD